MSDETKKYKVLTEFTLGENTYAVGVSVDLTDEQVAGLPEGSVEVESAE